MNTGLDFLINTTNNDGSYAVTAEQIDVVLAEVLRIFAARGRAIREERGREQGAELSNTPSSDMVDAALDESTGNPIGMERRINDLTPENSES